MNIFYYIFLMLIIIFLLFLGKCNLEVSPKKVKRYIFVVVTLCILRYISLLLLCVVQSGRSIYYFKSLIYSNTVIIPLLSIALIYINLRLQKFKFNMNYLIGIGILISYIIIIINMPSRILFDLRYGYIICLDNIIILQMINLTYFSILLVIILLLLGRKNSSREGMLLLIMALIVTIIEQILNIGGISLFPYPIIGEMLFFIISYKTIKKFK